MKYIFSLIISFTFFNLSAQNITDVIRYSNVEFGATGRAIGTGSSFSAIGADFSLIGSNPAGLAAFRKSELTLTPSFSYINTDASITTDSDVSESDKKIGVGLENFGLAFVRKYRSKKMKTLNFGMGINRIASFGKNISYSGSTTGSISDRWLELAQGFEPDELAQDPFEAGLALNADVIYQNGNTGARGYESDYQGFGSRELNKSQTINQKGYISEFAIALGSNFNDKLYVGGMLGLPILLFEEEKIYNEEDLNNEIDFFETIEFQENLSAAGVGVNFKLGIIYRLNQKLRFGLAGHTATVYDIEEDFSTSIDYVFRQPDFSPQGLQESPLGNFEYSLKTPWRLSGSVGSIIGRRGFVSAEVEYVDYGNSQFNFQSEAGSEIARQERLNDEIANDLNSALNIRFGGEWTYDIFRFRAGVNLLGAITDDLGDRMIYNAGLGLRKNSFFMDLGYRLSFDKDSFYAYQTQLSSSQQIEQDAINNSLVLTLGFKI